MIIGVFGKDKAREEWVKDFPRPFIISYGQVDAHLQHPGIHDLSLLAAWLLRWNGTAWSTPQGTVPAHDFSLKLGQLNGRALNDTEREQVSSQFVEAKGRLQAQRATPPLSIVINSAEDLWFSVYRQTNQPMAEWLVKEALEWLGKSTPVVLIAGDRPRYQAGEVASYVPNYPPAVERMVDISIEVLWDADLHTDAMVHDVRPGKAPGFLIGQSVTVADILSVLGHPVEAQDIKKD